MQSYQLQFIALATQCGVLKFGDFELKSGRTSPYFFNAGGFSSGASLALLGRCYAQAIVESALEFDVLLGPAYKGIPLAATTVVALAEQYGRDVPFAYNRKEAKAHGEGGVLVGAPLQGRILIIDDVITAGTAVRESITLIKAAGASLAGVVIGLDRKERGTTAASAVQEVEQAFGVPVASIITMDHLIDYLEDAGSGPAGALSAMHEYRKQYGV